MSETKMSPPDHLEVATREWWQSVVDDYELEEHHVRLLTLAAEAWDRGQSARDALVVHGMVYDDRFGQPRQRPEVAIERDARVQFARLVRELDLDHVAAPDARPPGLQSNRR
ncbi:P27 family phage terminase small subunit [Thioalkalivibrio sp. AKL19]|uniref:P27 family phage terminase small subunit n=1 Tax=Thioalkalivibrio sp. AKL19 TaxID=1266914 RepID=UPI0009DB70B5|nr:P27 family phage terminase small subunit [Thioalkalivibrio sp. AKL19]